MSRLVRSVGPGIGIAPIRMAPSMTAYHAGMRGSMMKIGSPFLTPRSPSARPARRDSRTRSVMDWSATSVPSPARLTSADWSAVSAAQVSRMSRTGLKRVGTSSRKLARSPW
jgi:hypothetical protein